MVGELNHVRQQSFHVKERGNRDDITRVLIHEQRTENGLARVRFGEHASHGRRWIQVIEQIRDNAVGRHREPVTHGLPLHAAHLPPQIVSQVGKGVAPTPAVILGDTRVSACEHDRLEQHAPNLLDVHHGKTHDVADSAIVDAVHDGNLKVRLHTGARDVLERLPLDIEQDWPLRDGDGSRSTCRRVAGTPDGHQPNGLLLRSHRLERIGFRS